MPVAVSAAVFSPEAIGGFVAAEDAAGGERMSELADVIFAEWRAERTNPFVGEEFDLVLAIAYRCIHQRLPTLATLEEKG